MKKKMYLPMSLQFFADEEPENPEPQPTSQQENNPEPQKEPKVEMLQFTQDALNAMLEKEKNAGKRSVMKQFQIKDEKDIPATLERFNAYREAEASKETDADKLVKALQDLEAERILRAQEMTELKTLKQEKFLKSKGVSEDQIDFMAFKVNQLVTDDVTFEEATEKYLSEHPIPKKPPEFYTGTGTKPVTQNEEDTIREAYKDAKQKKNTAKMAQLTRLAQEKNIKLN